MSSREMSVMIALLQLLVACGSGRGVREAPTEVTYGGWVYDSLLYEGVFAEGTLTFTLGSDVLAEGATVAAEQPYVGYEGYWLATLPPRAPFELRVEGEGAYATVWAGDTPGANGTWFPGALFAGRTVETDALLAGLELPEGVAPGALADGAIHLWGRPSDGTDWDCAAVRVNGVVPLCYVLEEDGALTPVGEGPFDMFFAFDLPPGQIVLEDGFGGGEAWTAVEGDLVMAWWVVHG